MKVLVKRFFKGDKYTIGRMFLDGEYFCDTMEDVVRPDGVKVYGETAIPAGIYNCKITYSPRFKKDLPLIMDVPGFEGVRIHSGNYAGYREYFKTIDIPEGFEVLNTTETQMVK